MITQLHGNIVEKNPAFVVIDCNGVGYMVNISLQTYSAIPDEGRALLYTSFIVREDAQLLYGFSTRAERHLFEQLISVSGIGASTARIILSSLTAPELGAYIQEGNASALQRIKGIGAKSAQRIIVDLKDKIGKDSPLPSVPAATSVKDEALAALVMLGFSRASAEKALERTVKETGGSGPVEEMIKSALKYL